MKVYIDESVSSAIARGLKRRGMEAVEHPEIICWALVGKCLQERKGGYSENAQEHDRY